MKNRTCVIVLIITFVVGVAVFRYYVSTHTYSSKNWYEKPRVRIIDDVMKNEIEIGMLKSQIISKFGEDNKNKLSEFTDKVTHEFEAYIINENTDEVMYLLILYEDGRVIEYGIMYGKRSGNNDRIDYTVHAAHNDTDKCGI